MCDLEACKAFVKVHGGARGACLFENSAVGRGNKYKISGNDYPANNYGVEQGRDYE